MLKKQWENVDDESPKVPYFDLIDEDGKVYKTITFESFSFGLTELPNGKRDDFHDMIMNYVEGKCEKFKEPLIVWRIRGICNLEWTKDGKWYVDREYTRFAIIEKHESSSYERWLVKWKNKNHNDDNKTATY